MKTPVIGKRPRRHAAIEAMEPRLLMSATAAALTLTDIAQFTTAVGHQSAAGLIRDASGNLFGTTTLGGTNNLGTVFKVANGSSSVTTIASFNASLGAYPTADLVMDSSGNLFGTTPYGGANGVGTVYEVAAGSSVVTPLASFTSAANDAASVKLVLDSHGNLFGTTPFGGNQSDGSIFEIIKGSSTITTLASFNTTTGDDPTSGLVSDSAGDLFGTTPRDGPDGFGSIYELPFNTSSVTVLAAFTSENSPEQASALTLDGQGNLFGTTQFGGINGDGSVYELPAGTSTIETLASFNSSNGADPSSASILDSSGDLFGTTPNGGLDNDGTVWEIVAGSGTISTVGTFIGTNGSPGTDGFSHNAVMPSLVADGHGDYFGVAPGGAPNGLGAVYSLTPQLASQIVVAQQPTGNITAGTTQALTLDLETVSNTIDPTSHAAVTVSILSGPTGGAISGVKSISAVAGVANFSGLSFNRAGVYTLTATSTGLTSAICMPFTVVAGAASNLVISQQPASTVAGQALATTVVEVTDGNGNVVTSDSSTLTVAGSAGVPLIGSTSAQAVAGEVTFTGLTIDKAGTYTLLFSDGSLPSVNSSSFVVTAAAASQLVVAQQPAATATAGQSIGTVTVDVDDAFGNLVSNSAATVALSTGVAITGTASKPAVAGAATFTGLSIDTSGAYTLAVSSSGLAATSSSSFVVNPGAATQLLVIQQPQPSTAAGDDIGSVTIAVEDAFGNAATTDTSTVMLATTTGSPLVGTTMQPVAAGAADFSGLSIDVPGTYTLSVTDRNLPGMQTASFIITPAMASQLVILQQPPASIVAGQTIRSVNVAVEDALGNVVTTDSSTLSVAIDIASLSGTTNQPDQNGIADFDDLSITTAGSYSLVLTDGNLAPAISSDFTIVPASTSQLVFTEIASAGTVKKPFGTVLVQLEDPFGNFTATGTSKVKIAADKKGVLTGTVSKQTQSGVATFTNLAFADAGVYTLSATDGAITPGVSNPITIAGRPGPVPKPTPHPTPTPLPLQPIVAIAGSLLPKIVIDSNTDFGISSDSSKTLTVTFDGNPANGVAVPPHTTRVVNGYSTIKNLRIRGAGTYTMVIADALGNTVTDQVTILPARPVSLQFASEPASVDGSTPVLVRAIDIFGNQTDAADGTHVSLRFAIFPLLGRRPKLMGTTIATLTDGIATFPDVTVDRKGRARLLALAKKLRPVASAIFVNR